VTNVTLACLVCGETFEPQRATARYCSPACRQRAHRQRRTAEPRVDTRIEALEKKLRWRRWDETPEEAAEQIALRAEIRRLERHGAG
jgi:hypothetical protein